MKWRSEVNKGSGWGCEVGRSRHQVRKFADRASTRTRIRCWVGIFPLWRPDSKGCGFRDPIRRVRVDGRQIRQHFFPDSGNPGSVWTGPQFASWPQVFEQYQGGDLSCVTLIDYHLGLLVITAAALPWISVLTQDILWFLIPIYFSDCYH